MVSCKCNHYGRVAFSVEGDFSDWLFDQVWLRKKVWECESVHIHYPASQVECTHKLIGPPAVRRPHAAQG